MHSSGSFILTVVTRIRAYLDDADLASKYDEDFITRHVITPAIQDVMARLSLMRTDPILLRYDIDLEAGQEYYQLPPAVASIWRLVKMDSDGLIEWEDTPRGEFHPNGPNWAVEGNLLAIRPHPTVDDTLTLWYVPSGDFVPHYSAAGGAVAADNLTLTLDTTPDYGPIDRRTNALAGSILRILPAAGAWQERIIASSTATAVVVRNEFDPSLASTSGIRYEIAPPMKQYLWEAIALAAAMKMATYKAVSGARRQGMEIEYRKAMKTCKDMAGMAQGRNSGAWEKATVDNGNLELLPPSSLWG